MKHLKLFEDFNSESLDKMDLSSEERNKLAELGLGGSKVVYFVSPLTVSEDYTAMYDYLQELDPRQVVDVLREYGFDLSYALSQMDETDEESETDPADAFFDEVWSELQSASENQLKLEDSSIDLNELSEEIVTDFNSANLFQYYEDAENVARSIKAVGLSDDGEFKVKVEFAEEATKEDIERMKEFLSGQYSDGWGEGFEQMAIGKNRYSRRKSQPDYYVHTWSDSDDWSIKETY